MTRIRDGDTGPGGGKTNLKLNALHYNKIRLYMHEFRDLASRLVTALCHISRFNDLHRHRGVAHRASPCPTTILLRFVQHSVMWKEMAASKIFTYQGLTTCTEVDQSWMIMSSVYSHLRQGRETSNSGLGTLIRAEVVISRAFFFFRSSNHINIKKNLFPVK